MKKFLKKFRFLYLALVFILAINIVPAYASRDLSTDSPIDKAPTINNNSGNGDLGRGQLKRLDLTNIFTNNARVNTFSLNGKKYKEVIVTDKELIQQIVQENNIANSQNITEITVGVFDDENMYEDVDDGLLSCADQNKKSLLSLIEPVTVQAATYNCKNLAYVGNNFYYPSDSVPYILNNTSNYAATLTQSVSITGTVSYSASVEADIKEVAKVQLGVTIGTTKTATSSVSVPNVPPKSYVTVLVNALYTKYSYDIFNGTVKYSTGSMQYPNGGVYYIIK
jgi:hypothetical protein